MPSACRVQCSTEHFVITWAEDIIAIISEKTRYNYFISPTDFDAVHRMTHTMHPISQGNLIAQENMTHTALTPLGVNVLGRQ